MTNGYNFTDRVRRALQYAREEAVVLRHEYVGTEHLLLGLLRENDGVAAAMLAQLKVESGDIGSRIGQMVKPGVGQFSASAEQLPYTSRATKCLELAMTEARERVDDYVGVEHLLLGLAREEKGVAAQALVEMGVTYRALAGQFDLLRSDVGRTRRAAAAKVRSLTEELNAAVYDALRVGLRVEMDTTVVTIYALGERPLMTATVLLPIT